VSPPDAVQAIRRHLAEHPSLVPVVDGRVHLTLPDPLVLPCVRLERIGGASIRVSNGAALVGPDRVDVSIHCWGLTITAAEALAALVRQVLAATPTAFLDGAVVLSAVESFGPSLIWDDARPDHPLPRVTLTWEFTCR